MRTPFTRFVTSILLILFCLTSGYFGATIALNNHKSDEVLSSKPIIGNASTSTEGLSKNTQEMTEASDWLGLLNQSITEITKDVSPSIVGISNKRNVSSGRNQGTEMEAGTGSGFIFDTKGYILTNHHVIDGADRVTVILHDGREISAEVIGKDNRTDLAVLKVNEEGLTAIPLGDSTKLKQGELAFAFGNPLGLELAGSVTMGMISGTGRTLSVDGKRLTLIQTDAAINPGNSGGPLVNIHGQVVGINTLKEFYAGNVRGVPVSVEGVGFAIPIDEARPIMAELMDQGFVTRPGLGVGVSEINKQQAEANEIPVGVYVSMVVEGGAADKAGILVEDIIIGLQGQPITTYESLLNAINSHKIGDTIEVTLWRDGQELKVSAVLEQLPQ